MKVPLKRPWSAVWLLSALLSLSGCRPHHSPSEWRDLFLSSDPNVRTKAADDFSRAQVPQEDRREIQELLLQTVKAEAAPQKLDALDALAVTVAPDLAPEFRENLLALVLSGIADPDSAVRSQSMRVAGRAGLHEMEPFVARAAEDPDPSIRIAAVETLGTFGTDDAKMAMASALSDADPQVAEAARATADRFFGDGQEGSGASAVLASRDAYNSESVAQSMRQLAAAAALTPAPPKAAPPKAAPVPKFGQKPSIPLKIAPITSNRPAAPPIKRAPPSFPKPSLFGMKTSGFSSGPDVSLLERNRELARNAQRAQDRAVENLRCRNNPSACR